MTIGSVAGTHQELRSNSLSRTPANVVAPKKKGGTAVSKGAVSGKHPDSSGKSGKSPSTKVTLSHSSEKDQQKQPLTYHKVTHPQPSKTPDPNTVEHGLAKDRPEGTQTGKDSKKAGASDKSKGTASAKADQGAEAQDVGKLKAFACGAVGIDAGHAKEKQTGYYNAGQVLKAVGAIGGVIALFV